MAITGPERIEWTERKTVPRTQFLRALNRSQPGSKSSNVFKELSSSLMQIVIPVRRSFKPNPPILCVGERPRDYVKLAHFPFKPVNPDELKRPYILGPYKRATAY